MPADRDAVGSSEQRVGHVPAPGIAPLSPVEAALAQDEARPGAAVASGELMASRRLRVEAEAKRISDEVTLGARHRSARHRSARPGQGARLAKTKRDARATKERQLPVPLKLRRVLVPLDGSAFAERALPFAAVLAASTGAHVVLAHVRTPPTWLPGDEAHHEVDMPTERREPALSDVPTYLLWARERLSPYGRRATIRMVSADSAAAGLLDLATSERIDLVVMASHARQGADRLLLGSVADEVIRHGHAPVLIIPPVVAVPLGASPKLQRALVPLDGSALSERALGLALGLMDADARRAGALREIALFSVSEPGAPLAHCQRYLDELQRRLDEEARPEDVRIIHAAVVGEPAEMIIAATKRGISLAGVAPGVLDLVIMGTHGRGGLGRWLYGSVASSVVARGDIPVLLVPAADGSTRADD